MIQKLILIVVAIQLTLVHSKDTYEQFAKELEDANTKFEAFMAFSEKPAESGNAIKDLLNLQVSIGKKVEDASKNSISDSIAGKTNDAKSVAKASVLFAQLVGDMDSIEPIFKKSPQYTETVSSFSKNHRDIDRLYYNRFMGAHHVNDKENWQKFNNYYIETKLEASVDSINKNHAALLTFLASSKCNKFELGKYCAYTINDVEKVLAMRGAAMSIGSSVPAVKANLDQMKATCIKSINAC